MNQNDEVCQYLQERLIKKDFIILDTETEGLRKGVIDLAIIDANGQVLFDSLIRNAERIEPKAQEIHKISEAVLLNAPTFIEVWPTIKPILESQPIVITYNAAFDMERLHYTIKRVGITWDITQNDSISWECLMLAYAEHWGEESWSGYRWQKLGIAMSQQGIYHNGYHRALGDAMAAYELMLHLAAKAGVNTEPLRAVTK